MCNSFLFPVLFRKILLTSYFTGTLLPDIAVLKKNPNKPTNTHKIFFFFFTLHVLDNFMPKQLQKFSFALMEFGGIQRTSVSVQADTSPLGSER